MLRFHGSYPNLKFHLKQNIHCRDLSNLAGLQMRGYGKYTIRCMYFGKLQRDSSENIFNLENNETISTWLHVIHGDCKGPKRDVNQCHPDVFTVSFLWASWQIMRYVILGVGHAPGILGTFFPPPLVSYPDMRHGTCVTHVPWCMPGSLTSGFLWSRWPGKRSQHSRRMRNRQFYVSGKRSMLEQLYWQRRAACDCEWDCHLVVIITTCGANIDH